MIQIERILCSLVLKKVVENKIFFLNHFNKLKIKFIKLTQNKLNNINV